MWLLSWVPPESHENQRGQLGEHRVRRSVRNALAIKYAASVCLFIYFLSAF